MTSDLPPEARIFTKTHRKMFLGSPKKILTHGVNVVKFYGHSLGESDYSYFHSIFDYYNLYDNNLDAGEGLSLHFYYTAYEGSENEESKVTDSVYRLITSYGNNTLSNTGKGKNLLHKLLLEGRIQIICLENKLMENLTTKDPIWNHGTDLTCVKPLHKIPTSYKSPIAP